MLYVSRKIGNLELEYSLLNQILTFERNSIAELLLLMNVGVAPFAEYTQFRRDYQVMVEAPSAILENNNSNLDNNAKAATVGNDNDNIEDANNNNVETNSQIQHFSILEYELQITQKKAMLLRTRRLDEERGSIASDIRYSSVDVQNSMPSPTKSGGTSRRPPRDSSRF